MANDDPTKTDRSRDQGGREQGGEVDRPKMAKGEVKEVLGAVTGDRRVEAEGRVEKHVADPQAPEQAENDGAVNRQERAVREAHHDVPPGGPERDTAPREGPLGT